MGTEEAEDKLTILQFVQFVCRSGYAELRIIVDISLQVFHTPLPLKHAANMARFL